MRILTRFMKPYAGRIALMLFLLLLQALGTLYIPTLMADIVNKGILPGDMDHIVTTSLVMLLAAALSCAVSVAHIHLSSQNAALIGRDLRNAVFEKTQALSLEDMGRFGVGSLITRNTSDATQIQTAFSTVIEMLLPAPFMTAAGLILSFSKDKTLALLIIAVMAVTAVLALVLSRKAIPMFDRLLKLLDAMNRTVLEKISGVRVIRAFNREAHEKECMDGSFVAYGTMAIRINRFFAILTPLITLVMNLCTLLIIGVGNVRVNVGAMPIGDLYAVIEYATITLTYLIMGLAAVLVIPRLNISAGRIREIFDTESSVPDNTSDDIPLDASTVEFRHVSFGYGQAEAPVLGDVSFTLKRGQTTAIIGSTGSGKSTLLGLLLRFYDPTAGQILLGGRDLREISLDRLRAAMGYVPQKAVLFSGTVADNLRHGKPDATETDMRAALETAQLRDFVEGLPEGLNAAVSQGGVNLSGGQKQRLSIARAIVRRPQIYIFDDSFSALDYKTDARLRAALKKETGDAAVLIVAQRVSTIRDAEQIVVMDQGRVVGLGSHRELLNTCPVYLQLAQSQLREEELV